MPFKHDHAVNRGNGARSLRKRVGLLGLTAVVAVAAAFAATAATSARADHGGNGKGNGNGPHHGTVHNSSNGGNAGGNSASANAADHVTICHATGTPDNAGNGYVRISPSASGVYHGHYRQHAADIIPPFAYDGHTYSLNWDAHGQSIWNNGCAAPTSSTSGPTPPTPSSTTPNPTTPNPTTPTPTTPTPTTPTPTTPAPGRSALTVQKLERINATGRFSRGPRTATVGDTVFYRIRVFNSGSTSLHVTLSDPRCDPGTINPVRPITLNPGGTQFYTCSHLLVAGDAPSFTNVATATAGSVSAASHVVTQVSAGGVAGVSKTLRKQAPKKVHKKAAPPKKAAVRAASFTG